MTIGAEEGRVVPYEILVEIFSRLSFSDVLSASLVCRLWHGVSCDVLLQRRAFCLDGGSAERAAPALARAVAPLSRLVVREAEVQAYGVLEEVWRSAGTALKELRLLGCTVKESDLMQILAFCPDLEELALVGCDSLFMTGSMFTSSFAEELHLPRLHALDLSHNRYLSDAILMKLLALSPGVDTLCLAGCQIGFHPGIYRKFYPGGAGTVSSSVLTFQCVLTFLGARAAEIVALDMSETNVDDAALSQLSALRELQPQRLALSRCRSFSDAGLAAFLSSQTQLEDVDLSGTRVADASLQIVSSLPSLLRLSLRQCDRLTSTSLSTLSTTRLLHLDLGCNERLPPDVASSALPRGRSPPLRRLSLRAMKLSPETVVAAATSLTSLTSLDLSRCVTGVTDDSVQAICRHLRQLQVLRLAECAAVTDSGLTGLGLASGCVAQPPKPNKTFLHGDTDAQARPPERRASLDTVWRNNRHAISLQSRHEREIWSDAERKHLIQGQIDLNELGSGVSLLDVSGLTELDLSQCGRISDVSVGHVIRFTSLRRLNVSHCAQLGDAGVGQLGRHCPALEHVSLAHCPTLGDDGLEELLQHARRLKHLDVSCCTALTDRSLRVILHNCARLRYLDLSGCGRMSSARAADLEELMPQLGTVIRRGLDGSGARGATPPPPPPHPPVGPTQRRR